MRKVLDKIEKQIGELSLNLTNKVLLTEAATGPYFVTSIIGALSGAKVFALAKDSAYGSASEVFEINKKILKSLNLDPDIKFIDKLDRNIIGEADIISNSGHLRPLDRQMLQHTKKGCVIPLMYESWELRESDIDIQFCKENNIMVGATNERHPDVNVFNYLGDMAMKLIFDSGICLFENNFVLISNNDFGPFIAKTLMKISKNVGVIDKKEKRDAYESNIDWLSDFPEIKISGKYRDCEAIIFTAYPFDINWIGGKNSVIPVEKIMSEFSNPYVLRFAGNIDTVECDKKGLMYFPQKVHSGHMGVLPSDIGFDPVIRLQAGGLKAGELMLQGKVEFKNEIMVELL